MIKILKEQAEINEFLRKNAERGGEENLDVSVVVKKIIDDVKIRGDEAVKEYTAKFDCENSRFYEVPREEIDKAFEKADADFINALKRCKDNITAFHEKQKREGYTLEQADGIILKQRVLPLERVGIYVPGGTAPLISSVLMSAVPAKIAGVKEIIMTTPPLKDGAANSEILAAAKLCGVDRVFLCGGAQAVAALAFGTREIPKVSKIAGPGNIYVTTAKRQLFGIIDIDMLAGPSEILIIADDAANPKFIAADMLSQAEHDIFASSVLVTVSDNVAEKVTSELAVQLAALPRKEIAEKSLQNHGAIIITKSMEQAIETANKIAPEHLEILTKNPFEIEEKIINAGSVFLGEYSPEPLGDYFAGTNHVLPTNGTARFFSPLSVESFMKKSSSIYYTKKALQKAEKDITLIAGLEGLDAHANSVKVRMENENENE